MGSQTGLSLRCSQIRKACFFFVVVVFLRNATYFSKYFWLKMFSEAVAVFGGVRESRSLAPYPADT